MNIGFKIIGYDVVNCETGEILVPQAGKEAAEQVAANGEGLIVAPVFSGPLRTSYAIRPKAS